MLVPPSLRRWSFTFHRSFQEESGLPRPRLYRFIAGQPQSAPKRDAPRRIRPKKLMLMLWDLDRLKSVNDREGHAAGNQYIKSFCGHLQRSLRKGALAFRIGGDEFLSFDLRLQDSGIVARRVRENFEHVSGGWASEPESTFDALVKLAARMYENKTVRRESFPDPLPRVGLNGK
jgi:diguanylate cyclase (GGDEF)-like protein